MDSSKIMPSSSTSWQDAPPPHLSYVIKVSSFGVPPHPPKGDDVIYVQPLMENFFFQPSPNEIGDTPQWYQNIRININNLMVKDK